MNLPKLIILGIVRLYKLFHLLLVKLMINKLRVILIKKITKMGFHVVTSDGRKFENGSLSKEREAETTPKRPTIQIHNPKFFERLAQDRGLGLGESYVEGWWDCDELDELSAKFLIHRMPNYILYAPEKFAHYLQTDFFNLQTYKLSHKVAKEHYDLGNAFFKSFLDTSMTYTCGYWKRAKDLDEAQLHKLELVAQKLKLQPCMRVLDIGCGWGSLAHYLADKYQVTVVACNIAKDGARATAERCKGLPVHVECCDYRELSGKFDRIVSLGMFEHVGPRNHKTFMEVVHRCLEDHGICLIQTIGNDDHNLVRDDPWYCTYIFPNGSLPRATEITQAASDLLTLEDWHNFGTDYSKTLIEWHKNFVSNWHSIENLFENPTKSYRMWTYYFKMGIGAFRARKLQLWQIILTKNGVPGGYDSVR